MVAIDSGRIGLPPGTMCTHTDIGEHFGVVNFPTEHSSPPSAYIEPRTQELAEACLNLRRIRPSSSNRALSPDGD